MWKFIGLRGVMMLDPIRGGYPAYWKENLDNPSVIMPRCFKSRFGMTYARFRQLTYCFKMAWSPTRKAHKGSVSIEYCPNNSTAMANYKII